MELYVFLLMYQDERDKLQEDFESAREAMEQLKQEKRSLLEGRYVPQAEVSKFYEVFKLCLICMSTSIGNFTSSHRMTEFYKILVCWIHLIRHVCTRCETIIEFYKHLLAVAECVNFFLCGAPFQNPNCNP